MKRILLSLIVFCTVACFGQVQPVLPGRSQLPPPGSNPPYLVDLISPMGVPERDITNLVFQWKLRESPDRSLNYSFFLQVWELNKGDTSVEAAQKNQPFYEVGNINSTKYESIKKFNNENIYLWKVLVKDKQGKIIGTSPVQVFTIIVIGPPWWNFCFMPTTMADVNICSGMACTLPVPFAFVAGNCNPAQMSYRIDNLGVWISLSSTATTIPCPSTPPLSVGQHTITFRLNCNCGQQKFCTYTINVYPNLSAQILDYPSGSPVTNICYGDDATLLMNGLPASCMVNWDYSINNGSTWIPVPGGGVGNNYNTNQINWFACVGTSMNVLFRGTVAPGCLNLPMSWPLACSNSIIVPLTVWCPPLAGNITATPNNFCAPPYTPVQLNLGGPIVGNLTWSSTGGTFIPLNPTIPNPIITFTAAGTYTVTCTISNGPCQPITRTIQIIVENPPSATLTMYRISDCWGEHAVLTLSNILPVGAPIKWEYQINCTGPWSSLNTGTGTVQNTNGIFGPSYPPLVPSPCLPDKLCWRAIISSPTGICPPTTIGPLTINVIVPPSAPVISPPGPFIRCNPPGNPFPLLTASTPTCGTGPFTYQWFLNGLPTAVGQSISPTNPGNYFVEVTNKNGCATVQSSNTVTVRDCITKVVISGPCTCISGSPVMLTANVSSIVVPPGPPQGCGGPYTYLWSTGATTQSITFNCPSVTTTYWVEVTNAMGCKTKVFHKIKKC
jgi:hypothetical protein